MQNTQVMEKQKQERERERRSDKITWSSIPSTPWKNLFVWRTLDPVVRGES